MALTARHTSTPWAAGPDTLQRTHPHIVGPDGKSICAVRARYRTPEERARARADRDYIIRCVNSHDGLAKAARALVAMTFAEAEEASQHGRRLMFCRCDVLNPCWDNRPDDVAGKHWGGGEACDECNLRAAIAKAGG